MSHGSVTDEGVTGSHFVCLIFVFHSTHFVKIISIFGRAVLDILCVLTRYLVFFYATQPRLFMCMAVKRS